MKQLTFASLAYTSKNEEHAQREVSGGDGKHCSVARNLETIIEPHYPKRGRRVRQPMPMRSMLRIYLMRGFSRCPILNFRRLLEKHKLDSPDYGYDC